jgi:hypothetical protein
VLVAYRSPAGVAVGKTSSAYTHVRHDVLTSCEGTFATQGEEEQPGLDVESEEGTVREQNRHVLVDADVVERWISDTRRVGIVGRTPDSYDEQVGQHQRQPVRPRSTSARTCPRSAFKTVPDAWCRRSASYPCDAMREDAREVSRCFSSRRGPKPSSVSSIVCENSVSAKTA